MGTKQTLLIQMCCVWRFYRHQTVTVAAYGCIRVTATQCRCDPKGQTTCQHLKYTLLESQRPLFINTLSVKMYVQCSFLKSLHVCANSYWWYMIIIWCRSNKNPTDRRNKLLQEETFICQWHTWRYREHRVANMQQYARFSVMTNTSKRLNMVARLIVAFTMFNDFQRVVTYPNPESYRSWRQLYCIVICFVSHLALFFLIM